MPTLRQVRVAIDAQFTTLWSAIAAQQDAYLAEFGRYWQGKRTASTNPAYGTETDGAALADQLEDTPTDIEESWLDLFPDLAETPLTAALQCDTYNGPEGHGYVATAVITYDGMTYTRSRSVGPEGWRTTAWRLDAPWYRAGGAPQPLAAYTAKGAESFAASLVNLANPGTHNLTEVGAGNVAWDIENGWGFAGDSALSMGAVSVPETFTVFVRVKNAVNAGTVYLFGAETGGLKFGLQRYVSGADGRYYVRRGDASTIISAYQASGTHAYTSSHLYSNGAALTGPFETLVQAYTLWLGGASGTALWWTGNIEYFALYDRELTPAEIQALHTATQDETALGGAVLMFDDGTLTDYTEAFAYMQPRGVRATSYVVSAWANTEGFATWAQLREMDAAEWDIGNHTAMHGELSSENAATVQAAVTTCKAALDAQGFSRASRHVAYPYGGTVSAGMLTGMAAAGMLTGRSTIAGTVDLAASGVYALPTRSYPQAATTLASVQAAINTARRNNTWCTVLLHGIAASPTNVEWSAANFQALIDWLSDGDIPCITITELYARMVEARTS